MNSPTPVQLTVRLSWPTRTSPSASADPEHGHLAPSLLEKDSASLKDSAPFADSSSTPLFIGPHLADIIRTPAAVFLEGQHQPHLITQESVSRNDAYRQPLSLWAWSGLSVFGVSLREPYMGLPLAPSSNIKISPQMHWKHATLCPPPPSSLAVTPRPRTNAISVPFGKRPCHYGRWVGEKDGAGCAFEHLADTPQSLKLSDSPVTWPWRPGWKPSGTQFAAVLGSLQCSQAPGWHWPPFYAVRAMPERTWVCSFKLGWLGRKGEGAVFIYACQCQKAPGDAQRGVGLLRSSGFIGWVCVYARVNFGLWEGRWDWEAEGWGKISSWWGLLLPGNLSDRSSLPCKSWTGHVTYLPTLYPKKWIGQKWLSSHFTFS